HSHRHREGRPEHWPGRRADAHGQRPGGQLPGDRQDGPTRTRPAPRRLLAPEHRVGLTPTRAAARGRPGLVGGGFVLTHPRQHFGLAYDIVWNASVACLSSWARMGSSITNLEPLPRFDVTWTSPLCSRTILRETGRPRPVPRPPFLDSKIWKIVLMSSGAMPTPLSCTLIRAIASASSHSVATST